MSSTAAAEQAFSLDKFQKVHHNLSVAELVEHALARDEGVLAANGALVSRTGKYTGRTPNDKFTVKEPGSEQNIWWESNNAMSPELFARIKQFASEKLLDKELYVIDTFGGADERHRISARFIVEKAWHALFIKQLLIRPGKDELKEYSPDWTIIDLSTESVEQFKDELNGEAVIALNFAEKTVIIIGTQYAGEMKKSVFTILNYLLPMKGVMSMHCSANVGEQGDTALFFGLSGTGKTTLSADPHRRLIGDDEHGWTDDGVFNFEGGCYAKCIKLSREGEPEIFNAIRFGSVLENVILVDGREPDYDDASLTENTRCAYPIDYIDGALMPSVGGHPKNILFLTADAFGVLPPISQLDPQQAMFYFLNGYTAKVAGTEAGVTEPQAVFSTCFGQPFLPCHPHVYAELLKDKIAKHGSKVWLVNTGWTGGAYGEGNRISLQYTRALINAALSGKLDDVEYVQDPVFGLSIPTSCPSVPDEILNPRNTWSDPSAYDAKANELKAMFEKNYERFSR